MSGGTPALVSAFDQPAGRQMAHPFGGPLAAARPGADEAQRVFPRATKLPR